eukprot:204928-Pleurochrysis_carterae.AAC.1
MQMTARPLRGRASAEGRREGAVKAGRRGREASRPAAGHALEGKSLHKRHGWRGPGDAKHDAGKKAGGPGETIGNDEREKAGGRRAKQKEQCKGGGASSWRRQAKARSRTKMAL